MRSTRLLFVALILLVSALPVHAAVVLQSPAAVANSSLGTDSVPTVRAAILPSRHAPAPGRSHRLLDGMAIAAIGATSKRKSTRRKAGVKREIPLYLDSDAHVMREDERTGHLATTVIRGGVLVDDTDLTDDEIDELTALRAIRHATTDEIARLEQKDADAERTELMANQAVELEELRARQDAERAELEAKGPTDEQRSTQSTRHSAAMTKLQEKHAAALAKLDE